MNVTIDEITPMLERLSSELGGATSLLSDIGNVVRDCTLENFGSSGTNRPSEWPMLSKRYAKRVGRDYATLEVSGDLKNSIQEPNVEGFSVSVKAADEKASYHQLGEGHNRLRPFFPIDDANGELTPYCEGKIRAVMDEHFSKI